MLPDPKDLANAIKEKRTVLGLTQTKLARSVGVRPSTINRIESCKLISKYELYKKIFDFLQEEENFRRGRLAKDLYDSNHPIVYIDISATIGKAARIMREKGYSQLPIISEGKSIASISEKKIVGEGRFKARDKLFDQPVMSIKEEAFPTVSGSTPEKAIQALLVFYKAVLVTENGQIVGIITHSNLLY